jgi:RNA polymerase sigma-70 factor, ECF subfamily
MRVETDRALVEGLRAGEQEAVAELVRLYGQRVFQLAVRYLKNHEDAEEVAQDVLLKVSDKIEAFRGDSALSSWIYRITFNTAMSRLRNSKADRLVEVADERLDGEAFDGAGPAREMADWSALADAIRDLPAIYRAPVILRDLQGLTTGEASRVLRVKDQTLKSRLHRGRVLLRQRLADFSTGLTMHQPLPA